MNLWELATPTADQASVDAYADLTWNHPTVAGAALKVLEFPTSGPVGFDFKNSGAQTITVQILTSCVTQIAGTALPDAEWNPGEVAAFDIAAGAVAFKEIQLPSRAFCKVQFKAKVGGAQGALRARVCQKRV